MLRCIKANVAVDGIVQVLKCLRRFYFDVPRYIVVIFKGHPKSINCHVENNIVNSRKSKNKYCRKIPVKKFISFLFHHLCRYHALVSARVHLLFQS